MSFKSTVVTLESQLAVLLNEQFIDEPTWCGFLTYTHSKFLTCIMNGLTEEVEDSGSISWKDVSTQRPDQLLEYIWNSCHSKILRYFHLQFHHLKTNQLQNFKVDEDQDDADDNDDEDEEDLDETKQARNRVGYATFKKVYGKYTKINKMIVGFYLTLIEHILKNYNISDRLFPEFYKFYRINYPLFDANSPKSKANPAPITDQRIVNVLIYFLHRICFFQGTLSRYRTLFYLYILSSSVNVLKNKTIISGKAITIHNGANDGSRFIRFETFDKSIEYFNFANKVLPGFSDPLSHIGMIMNSYGSITNANIYAILASFNKTTIPNSGRIVNGDKFEAVYYFIRSVNQKSGTKSSMIDIQRMLSTENEMNLGEYFLNAFTKCQEIEHSLVNDSSIIGDNQMNDRITRNKLLERVSKTYFLLLFSWYFYGKSSVFNEMVQRLKQKKQINVNEQLKLLKYSLFNIIKSGLQISEKNVSVLEKQLVILIGGFQVLLDMDEINISRKTASAVASVSGQTPNGNNEPSKMKIKDFKLLSPATQQYLKFVFQYIVEILNVLIIDHKKFSLKGPLSLEQDESEFLLQNRMGLYLPMMRIFLNWIRPSKLLINYCHGQLKFVSKMAFIINIMYDGLVNHNPTYDTQNSEDIFSHRCKRLRFFEEDVTLSGFMPVDSAFKDFNDTFIKNESKFSKMRMVGQLPAEDPKIRKMLKLSSKGVDPEDPKSEIIRNEKLLRVYAIGWLGKRLVFDNSFGIEFDDSVKQYGNLERYEKEIFDTAGNNDKFKELPQVKSKTSEPNNKKWNKKTKLKKNKHVENRYKERDTDFDDEKSVYVRTSRRGNNNINPVKKEDEVNTKNTDPKPALPKNHSPPSASHFEDFEDFESAEKSDFESEVEEEQTTAVQNNENEAADISKYQSMVDSLLGDDSITFSTFNAKESPANISTPAPESSFAKSKVQSTSSIFTNQIWSNHATSPNSKPMLASDLESKLVGSASRALSGNSPIAASVNNTDATALPRTPTGTSYLNYQQYYYPPSNGASMYPPPTPHQYGALNYYNYYYPGQTVPSHIGTSTQQPAQPNQQNGSQFYSYGQAPK
ncbi:Ebs1 protein [Saccharomycopsis crataegensis]|uniref:Ebs1 protein n=1 Tax=Saccharomycopsis crataegensis TaxID=43959 RepID=A0AAV5QGK9_9ASCO|nr:Ebs1 protein [Saccharomycopsis crataegensis]